MTNSVSSKNNNAAVSSTGWPLAWRFARREIRGSVRRFRVFLMALMLGVAAIGTVGSVAEAMRDGIADNARILLGGDVELRSRHTEIDQKLLAIADSFGTLSTTTQMRAMLQTGDERKLVELKAVDSNWPLVGAAELTAKSGATKAATSLLPRRWPTMALLPMHSFCACWGWCRVTGRGLAMPRSELPHP